MDILHIPRVVVTKMRISTLYLSSAFLRLPIRRSNLAATMLTARLGRPNCEMHG